MPTSSHDEATFTEIFELHRNAVHGYFVGRVSDPELARDLLQETFLRLWRRLEEVSLLDADRQRAWLFTVARNLTIDTYRARSTRDATVEALGHEAAASGDATGGGMGRVEGQEQLARLNAAIRQLPEEQRVILSMATLGELTSSQIGEALDQPAGTVRYKLHQARQRLAADLKEGSDDA